MNKNLPKVFAVPIEKRIENNKDVFMSSDREVRSEVIDKSEITKIFNSTSHVYKTRVLIRTQNDSKKKDIVRIKNENLLIQNEHSIPKSKIIEIKKV